MSSDPVINQVPQEILQEAESALAEIIPTKSRKAYENVYSSYTCWKASRGIAETNEKVLLAYFKKQSDDYKPTTLWSNLSMLKAMINLKEKIDIEKFNAVSAFLKQKSRGYSAKKSKIFSASELENFLKNAPDQHELDKKVIAIYGIFGALRGDELIRVTVQDVQRQGNIYLIKVPVTKNMNPRFFVITEEYCPYIEKYINLRPKAVTTDRFFLNYKNRKCTVQPIGKNKIASTPQKIAEFLNLPNPKDYTGHSFRRSSATMLVDAGATMPSLKRLGGWKSDAVAEGYIDESMKNKTDVGNLLTNMMTGQSTSPTLPILPPKGLKIQDENTNHNNENSASSINNDFFKEKNFTFENCNVTINLK